MKKSFRNLFIIAAISTFMMIGLVGCAETEEPEVQVPIQAETAPTPEPEPDPLYPIEDCYDCDCSGDCHLEECDCFEHYNGPMEDNGSDVNSDIHGAITRIEYGDNVVYLFGSIHGGRPEWYPLAEIVENALNRADVVASEVGNISEEVISTTALEFIMLPDGQTWIEFLPQEAYEHMVEVSAAWDLVYEEVNTLHPSFLISSIEMQFAVAMTDNFDLGGLAGDISVDGYVMGRALERGIPIIGLESIEQQLEILYQPPMDVMIEQIMYFFLTPEEMAAYMEQAISLSEMAEWYERNDFDTLNERMHEAFFDDDGVLIESLYLDYFIEMTMNWRSIYYANEIARLLQETEEPTTFFVVVGLTHVIRSSIGEGFTDIVEQLELLGFDTVRLVNS